MIYDKKFKDSMYYEFKTWVEDENYTMISEPEEYHNAKSKHEMLCPVNHHISINRNNWKSGKRCRMCTKGYHDVNNKRKCVDCCKWLDIETHYHKNKHTCKECRLEHQRSIVGKKQQQKRSSKWNKSKKGIEFNKKYKISRAISCGIRNSLIDGKDGKHWEDLVGFTLVEFKQCFEKLFVDGMCWENHGEWHIDHIRPIASFNITSYNCEDFKKCWSLENLQPLWAQDNIIKKDKWDGIINL